MAWKVELSPSARRDIDKLDRQHAKRILRFISERLANLEDPRTIGEALVGQRFGDFWRYRVGDYRLLCKIQDEQLALVVIKVGHRREVYRP